MPSSGRRVQVLLHKEKTELIVSIVQVLVPSAAIGPVMFSKLVMFPLSASNEPEKEDLKELNGKLNDFHEMVRQLEAVKSTMNEEMEGYESELVRLDNADLLEDVDTGLKQARRAIADLERVIDETNDIIEEKEEFATIAKVEKSNKVAKHAPKDDGSDADNNHIIPAGVDVVARQKKQDEKKSSAAKLDEEMDKLDEEMDILDEEVKEIEVKLKDHYERINRLERIKSTLMDTIDVERYWQADTEQMQLRVGLRAVLKKPRDVERYVQADAEQIQLKLSVQAIQEIVEKKKEELEVIWKRMKELEERKSDSAETI